MAHLRLATFGAEHNDASLCRTLMREYAAFLNAYPQTACPRLEL